VSGARWLWVSAAVMAADRVTKYLVERYAGLSVQHRLIPDSDIVALVYSQNPGIAFGVYSDSTPPWLAPVLLTTAVVVVIFLIWMIVTNRAGSPLAECGLALILGGAAGNAIDRVIHPVAIQHGEVIRGGVTDFLAVRLWKFPWPAFNVADSAITIGALLLFYELFLSPRREQK
jgi:signal peptidase II